GPTDEIIETGPDSGQRLVHAWAAVHIKPRFEIETQIPIHGAVIKADKAQVLFMAIGIQIIGGRLDGAGPNSRLGIDYVVDGLIKSGGAVVRLIGIEDKIFGASPKPAPVEIGSEGIAR